MLGKRERGRQTDREIDRETDRQTDRQTETDYICNIRSNPKVTIIIIIKAEHRLSDYEVTSD